MALSISTSNVLIGVTPTITDAGTGELAANISDPDHSLNYTCGSSTANFTVNYGARTNISYVGVSGHNAATPANATVQLYDGATLIDAVTIKRNHNIMFTFATMNFADLKVVFITAPLTYQTTLSFMAAGQHLTIASGEQAGYNRAWLNRSTVQKTTTDLSAAPVSGLITKKARKQTLRFSNQAALFTEDQWQGFIDFSFEQPFFIKEQASKPESSYLCFKPAHDIDAHSQTRDLNVIILKFTAFTGL
jgi:hypothetical protein